MEVMDACPSCGGPIGPDDATCPSCGAVLEGRTASFDVVVEPPAAGLPIDVDASEVPVLVVGKGAEVGERFYLERPEVTIGRDPVSDIFLNDVTVSRNHARLIVTPEGVTVHDVGSLNGTYVNDDLVESALLTSGDSLQIGRFRMVFLAGGGV
jgi:hypothetical protein